MRLEILCQDLDISEAMRSAIARRLQFMLARFCTRISRVTVQLADPEGTAGDMKVQCRIVICLVPFGRVCIEVAAVDLDTALDWAANRIGPAVNRELLRWRDNRGMPTR